MTLKASMTLNRFFFFFFFFSFVWLFIFNKTVILFQLTTYYLMFNRLFHV